MEKKRLGDICEIVTGATPKTNIKEFWDGDINWITPAELTEDTYIINESLRKITTEGVEKTGLKSFPKGTVILSSRAPIGKVAIAGCEMYCNQGFKNLVCSKQINNRFLYWYLKGHKEYLNSLGRGATFKEISKAIVENIEICLPTLEKQEKYADILEQCNGIIQIKKGQLRKLDTLVKSRFAEMFGDPIQNPYNWSIKSLLEMGYCKNGMNFHTGDSGIELYCLGVGDFKNYSIIDGTDQLSKISLNEMPPEESMLQNGDIVFVRSNGNKDLVGRCVLVYPHDVQTTYSGFCIRYRLTSREVNKNYLLRVLKTDSMRKQMTGRGANIQNLNQKTLATLNIPIPPIELQNQFADFVASIDKSKSKIQKSLQETQLLFDSLMQKYFG